MSKYRINDIIEKMDGNIAKILLYLDGTYYVGCQGEYWYLKENEIKGLCCPKPVIITRFELMEL